MSHRPWPERVRDILDVIEEIGAFCAGMSFEEFEGDAKTRKAVAADLAIVGEAARHVPDEVANDHPEVPWAVMRGMRNRIIHVYFDVDPGILWDTVKRDLPPLIPMLAAMIADEPG